jgi:hypothetical protein
LQANVTTLPEFNNPLELLDKIRNHVRELSDSAQQSAIRYYNQWFIYDQAGLTFESLTGMVYNVRSALESINDYLVHLEQNQNLDPSILPVLLDTRHRVTAVIDQYKKIKEKGEALKTVTTEEEKAVILKESIELSRNLIEMVYDQFMVLKARSGFLSNRLTSFVKYDFQRMLKESNSQSGEISDSTVRDIYFATGDAAFEKMKLMSSKNPKNIQSDLDNAQITNKENLRALEMLIKDNFISMMAYLKKVSEGTAVSNDDIYNDSRARAWKDYWRTSSLPSNPFALIVAPLKFFDFLIFFNKNPSRYPHTLDSGFGNNSGLGIIDNENGAAKRMLAHYCIQSLAFTDWRPFYDICKDEILNSPYLSSHLNGENLNQFANLLNAKYETELSAHIQLEDISPISNSGVYSRNNGPVSIEMLEERKKNIAMNQTSRICSMRQFARNNYIIWMTRIAPYEDSQ